MVTGQDRARGRSRSGWAGVVVVAAAGLAGAGYVQEVWPGSTSSAEQLQQGGRTTAEEGPAAEVLGELDVRPAGSMAGYDREQFGQRWSDDVSVAGGRNGCDTRNDVLRRDLEGLRVESGTQGCVALSGTLTEPYTGQVLPFQRGEDSGSQIHVDHLVSLGNAWGTGAQDLSPQQRQDLANDPLNLWAVDGRQNQSKGDAAADEWLPEDVLARCRLVAHQVAVKARYGLWVTPPERDAMTRVLDEQACAGQSLPTEEQTRPPSPRRGEGR